MKNAFFPYSAEPIGCLLSEKLASQIHPHTHAHTSLFTFDYIHFSTMPQPQCMPASDANKTHIALYGQQQKISVDITYITEKCSIQSNKET